MKFSPCFVGLLFVGVVSCFGQEPESPEAPKAAAPADPNVVVERDVVVGTGGGRPMHIDLAYPKNPPKEPMPAILYIHGGGWSKGDHHGNAAKYLVKDGYFTASIEYRLSGEAQWPAQIEDCKLAVRWLRANAAKYHVNPDKIGVWGSSAGGHLAACLGTMGDEKTLEGNGGHEGVSSKVQAVVNFYGPADFTTGAGGVLTPPGRLADYDPPNLIAVFGGGFKEKGDIWRQASPVLYAKAGQPPFLICHGDKDAAVPLSQGQSLEAALKKAGVPVELVVCKGGGHGFKAVKDGPEPVPSRDEINGIVKAFFEKTLK